MLHRSPTISFSSEAVAATAHVAHRHFRPGAIMKMLNGFACAVLLLVEPSFEPAAWAQSFPSRAVHIVTSEPGGGGDFVARLIAQGISPALGQSVVVDNRPSGVIPAQTVAQAPPDGHTLLVFGNSVWIGSLIQPTPYDPQRDFSPVTMATRSPNILVVHPSLPVKSVADLVALAKARPGELNYASGAVGGAPHVSAELFKALARVNMVGVPFKGAGPSLIALIGGEVQLTFASAASVVPHIKAGRLRALGVTTAQPSALAPGLATVAA